MVGDGWLFSLRKEELHRLPLSMRVLSRICLLSCWWKLVVSLAIGVGLVVLVLRNFGPVEE
jgi:hypothetical protein